MIAFQVEIDGELVAVAGTEDWSVLALHITGSRGSPTAPVVSARADRVAYSVGGLSEPDAQGVCHHFRWKDRQLSVGSKVVVTIVDVDTPDPPIKRFRSDAEVQESGFTDEEMRELRYQDYLELKKEFEGS
jgi:hypothetical protein